jgi:glutathione synthase/RimK-type ligase-like ATP-grasp enzyme
LSSLSRKHIELWVEARGGAAAINPVMGVLVQDLEASGAIVDVRVPEHEVVDPRSLLDARPPDLVLLKTATTLSLSLALADESLGVKFLNGARDTLCAHDKAATVARLAAAGLPVPETFLVQPGTNGKVPPSGAGGAWVAKPTRGVHGCGVAVYPEFPTALDTVATLDDDSSYVVDDGTRLLQHRIGGAEGDVKVYVAGERMFAGFKKFGPDSYAANEIEAVTLDARTEEMIHAVGEALDLRLFGVDLRFEDGEPVVIDANPLPGYRGFREAIPALRAEIERALGVVW